VSVSYVRATAVRFGNVLHLPHTHRQFGDALAWYVPLGLAAWFKARGISNVAELDWWEERQHPGSEVGLDVAAVHFALLCLPGRSGVWAVCLDGTVTRSYCGS